MQSCGFIASELRSSDAKGHEIGSLYAFGVTILELFDAPSNADQIDFYFVIRFNDVIEEF